MEKTLTPIERACAAVGGQANLARAINQTPAMVNQWCRGRRPISMESCPEIESATGVRCEELRPDLLKKWAIVRASKFERKVKK